LETKQAFAIVLNFHGNTPICSHALCHFCYPLSLFLIQAMKLKVSQDTSLRVICGILTTLGHYVTPTSLYKRCQQSQHFTRHNDVNAKVMVARLFLSFLTYVKTWILNTFFASTSFICNANAFLDMFATLSCYNYMTRFPLVIQGMNNKKKCINTFLWHPKIKRYGACITWLKGWKNKPFFFPLGNPRQKFIPKLLPLWKIQPKIQP
jgi:hypothetical protein